MKSSLDQKVDYRTGAMMGTNRFEMRSISLIFSGFQALNRMGSTLHGESMHALTGANGVGKSMLVAMLCDTHAHYEGEVTINNQSVTIRSPRDVKQLGIHLVQQEIDVALTPGLGIAENIMLDRLAEPGMAFRWSRVRQLVREALTQSDVALGIRHPIDSCTLAEKQQILLAYILSYHCRFLTLDEPTAPLDQHESEWSFAVVHRLQQQGVGVVFISHHTHELKAVCDTLTVLRDGRLVGNDPMASLSDEQIVEKMLGHELNDTFPPPYPPHGEEVLLQIDGLHDGALLQDISLYLQKGEILGITGLADTGRTGLYKTLLGVSKSRVQRDELNG